MRHLVPALETVTMQSMEKTTDSVEGILKCPLCLSPIIMTIVVLTVWVQYECPAC